MGQVRWTAEAERWLREIHAYIAEDNPSAATRTVRAILDRAKALADLPEIGYIYKARSDRRVRILLYGHYRIAYLIKPGDEIDILGVFHGALDIDRFLG